MNQPLLSTFELTKSFGGLIAVDNVSIAFERSKVHAIIGPNGAGKTTLINLLSGDLTASSGSINFKEHNLSPKKAYAISQLGIGRSYQKTNIFLEFTCLQNCWLGAQSRMSTSMRFFKSANTYTQVRTRAERALGLCGLEKRINTRAAELSYGEQRQLEIGMMLATEPELLLLDEPLAGMGTDESRQVVALIKRLAREHTVVLIEHDMDAVFALADVLTVMVNGKVLATGSPLEIRANSQVQDAYLGSGEG
ncbi:MAG: ABC transporter ATP-binding protein [Rhodospirillales bacterium]|nr:ABC transporter ATP-binding protein [Rhodospirillales bacterium]